MSLRDNYTTEEPKEFTLLPPGEYPFVVQEVYEWELSKKGNDMLPVEILIDGKVKRNEYLVFIETAKWKIDSLLKAVGIPVGTRVDWNNPGFLRGRSGVCRVTQKEIPRKNGDGMMTVNEIEGYCYDGSKSHPLPARPAAAKPSPAAPPQAPAADDDDIPF